MPTYVLTGHPRKRIYPDGQDADGNPIGKSVGVGEPFTMSEGDALNLELNHHAIKRVDAAEAKELRAEAKEQAKDGGPVQAASVPSGAPSDR